MKCLRDAEFDGAISAPDRMLFAFATAHAGPDDMRHAWLEAREVGVVETAK